MNETLTIDLPRIYKKEQIPEFEKSRIEIEEFIQLQEAIVRGFIHPATKKIDWEMPPKLHGKPLSEYVKEIKQ